VNIDISESEMEIIKKLSAELGISPKAYLKIILNAADASNSKEHKTLEQVSSGSPDKPARGISWNKPLERWYVKHRGKYIGSTKDYAEAVIIRDAYFALQE